MTVTVELFTSGHCSRCAEAKATLQEVLDDLDDPRFDLRIVDVVENLDHAVATGVLMTPALALDGELICGPLPDQRKLRQRLLRALAR